MSRVSENVEGQPVLARLKTGVKQNPVLGPIVSYVRYTQTKRLMARQQRFRERMAREYSTISRDTFMRDLREAIEQKRGYAVGKIGKTAQYMVRYDMLLKAKADEPTMKAFLAELEYNCLNQQGIFPSDQQFFLEYGRYYMEQAGNLDCLGICFYEGEREVLDHYGLHRNLIHYLEQEPDRSTPSDEARCYLPYLRDKKVLIICPFGGLLQQRANKETFEAVWAKTGKQWFHPRSVEALEFPYGFAPATREQYRTILDLKDDIVRDLESRDFDVALIAAAGLAIPLASHIKSMGKVAIDLGGHLQVLFGVLGQRWRHWEDWKRDYFNEHWIDMPESYKPKQTNVCDRGAYW